VRFFQLEKREYTVCFVIRRRKNNKTILNNKMTKKAEIGKSIK